MPKRSRITEDGKDPRAVELGRRGGLKGGNARAAKMTPEERAESARRAAQARWAKEGKTPPARVPATTNSHAGGRRLPVGGEEMMIRARRSVLVTMVLLAGALALSLVLLARGSSGNRAGFVGKLGAAEATESAVETPGLGPNSYEAYLQAERTYPANNIPLRIQRRAKATFSRIARADLKRMKQVKAGHGFLWAHSNGHWKLYGPKTYGVQPGVTSFSGATNVTASRVTALVADPDCTSRHCRLWAGVSGGGVWETDNALADNPTWQQLSPDDLDQNSVGSLVLDPSDRHHDTLYLGTGEGNHCSSGCEAGVGLYKSTNGGHTWHKLRDACVSNATFTCVTPGQDSFLG